MIIKQFRQGEVNLSDACNYRCVYCIGQRDRSSQFFPNAMIKPLIDELKRLTTRVMLPGHSGEPTLHPMFSLLVQELKSAGIEIGVYTNGTRLGRNGILDALLSPPVYKTPATYVNVHLSTTNPAAYAKIHGAAEKTLERVLNNLKLLMQAATNGPLVRVIAQLTGYNYTDLDDLKKFIEAMAAIQIDKIRLSIPYPPIWMVANFPSLSPGQIETIVTNKASLISRANPGVVELDAFRLYPQLSKPFKTCIVAKDDRFIIDTTGAIPICAATVRDPRFEIGPFTRAGGILGIKEELRNLLINVEACPPCCLMDWQYNVDHHKASGKG